MKVLKQRFSQWYNRRHERCGTLWEERFRSVLVEGEDGRALVTMAAYIDLNPVRAGMVEDPAAYRWSGYGEAMAGSGRARAGLALAMRALSGGGEVGLEEALAGYRCQLYVQGEAVPGAAGGRPGVDRAAVLEVLGRAGKVPLAEALRCRVRAFCDGVVLGSRAFVEAAFARRRPGFGSRRQSGARGIAGCRSGELWVLRELREGGAP